MAREIGCDTPWCFNDVDVILNGTHCYCWDCYVRALETETATNDRGAFETPA